MYGAMIGDITGSMYEFLPVRDKDFYLFPEGCGPTDDSVMTVAIAEAVMDWDVSQDTSAMTARFTERMLHWGTTYPNAGYGCRFKEWLRQCDPRPYNSFGNGSAMRVSPCAWVAKDLGEARHLATLSAAVTHNHPEGIKGAEAVASAIYMARTGSSKEEIRRYIENEFGYDLHRSCDEIRPAYSFNVTCQGSVPEAIISFLDGEDYEDTIRNAISLGGDADTQAAIAGSIAEAYFGIPQDLIDEAKAFIPEDMQSIINRFYSHLER